MTCVLFKLARSHEMTMCCCWRGYNFKSSMMNQSKTLAFTEQLIHRIKNPSRPLESALIEQFNISINWAIWTLVPVYSSLYRNYNYDGDFWACCFIYRKEEYVSAVWTSFPVQWTICTLFRESCYTANTKQNETGFEVFDKLHLREGGSFRKQSGSDIELR